MSKKHYYSILDWANKKEWEEYAKKLYQKKEVEFPKTKCFMIF